MKQKRNDHKLTAMALALTIFLSGTGLPTLAAEPEETIPRATAPKETAPIETVPEETQDTAIDLPVYYQEDYPDTPYGGGTVGEGGSGITCLAMVASYLTGEPHTPDQLAEGAETGADWELTQQGIEKLGLKGRKAADAKETFQAVKDGCVAICKMGEGSVFADSAHVIVLTQITEEDRVRVADPMRSNREKSRLKAGYEKGFPKGWISTGWEAAWIFDPNDVFLDTWADSEEKVTQMPLYNQMDYPDQRYGEGTVATSGCGITALAMVATYMTGHTYYPDQLADYFGGYNGSNVERLLNASDQLQLPYHAVENWHVALKELKEGKIAIVLMGKGSHFTDSQHFLVATGVTEDGKVRINDPYGPNYDNAVLKEGFANGFPSGWISTGYSAAWVYDVDEMPEEPFLYVEEEEPDVEPRYEDLNLSDEDVELLVKMVWVEARGEEDDGQQAVAEVILNRVASPRFPNTVRGVVYAEDQFRGVKNLYKAEPTQTQYEAVERAIKGPYILPTDVMHFATYPVNNDVWGTIGSHTFCYQWRPEE